VVRRNRELEELQRQLDQEVRALRARRGENPPAAADLDREARAKTLSERERELRERDLERSRENVAVAESARLRALEELDQAQRALQEAQARVAGLRAPDPGKPDPSRLNVSVFDYTLRLLREDDGTDRVLAVTRVVAPEGKWVMIQLPTGKSAPRDEGAKFPVGAQLVRVRAARDAGRMVFQIDWPAAGLDRVNVVKLGDPVRFTAEKDRLAQLEPQNPNVIEVLVQPMPASN